MWIRARRASRLALAERSAGDHQHLKCSGEDALYWRGAPVAGVPAPIVGSVKPKFAPPELKVTVRPWVKPAPGGVARERAAMPQKASVDNHSAGRDRNRIAGDGGDDL